MARVRELRYGADPSQFAELSIPVGIDGPVPVAVIVHGGFWRSRYDLALGRPLAVTLPPRGWAALNVEYRRVGNGGGFPPRWPMSAPPSTRWPPWRTPGPDARRRHRALGGWAAGGVGGDPHRTRRGRDRRRRPGRVLDLRRAASDRLGEGATQAFLGGTPGDVPERYDAASPIEHVPLGVPVLCVHGRRDVNVPIGQSEAFVAAAVAAGDDAELLVVDGDHFVVIDPARPAWAAVLEWLDHL